MLLCMILIVRFLMDLISFEHGGDDFDRFYPEGIPTQVKIDFADENGENKHLDSGMILYPLGHARNDSAHLEEILMQKFIKMGALGLDSSINKFAQRLKDIEAATPDDIFAIYDVDLAVQEPTCLLDRENPAQQ